MNNLVIYEFGLCGKQVGRGAQALSLDWLGASAYQSLGPPQPRPRAGSDEYAPGQSVRCRTWAPHPPDGRQPQAPDAGRARCYARCALDKRGYAATRKNPTGAALHPPRSGANQSSLLADGSRFNQLEGSPSPAL